MKNLPEFLYTPNIPSDVGVKLIFSPKYSLYWQVYEFDTINEQLNWVHNNDDFLNKSNVLAVNLHKKYPILLLCVGSQVAIDLSQEKLDYIIAKGSRACDWYVQFWIKEKQNFQKRGKTDFSHFYICENRINHDGQESIIKLSEPQVFITYNLKEAFFANFEDFYNGIASVNWLSGYPPSEEEQKEILIDCWNYLCKEEDLLDEFLERQ